LVHAVAFDFYGCVPREVWWDNPTTVVRQLFTGREPRLHPRYAALASHYNFEPLFCLPGWLWPARLWACCPSPTPFTPAPGPWLPSVATDKRER
jgi:hypothetical protein